MAEEFSCSRLTSAKWQDQQLNFLHAATLWKLQWKHVGGALPSSLASSFQSLQYLRLFLYVSSLILYCPRLICLQWNVGLEGSSPSPRTRVPIGRASSCPMIVCTSKLPKNWFLITLIVLPLRHWVPTRKKSIYNRKSQQFKLHSCLPSLSLPDFG